MTQNAPVAVSRVAPFIATTTATTTESFRPIESFSSGQQATGSPSLVASPRLEKFVNADERSREQCPAQSLPRVSTISGSQPEQEKKMSSSQSPTQSNDGRSYEHYFQHVGSQQGEIGEETEKSAGGGAGGRRDPSLAISHDQRTIQDNDTGAVAFESPVANGDSQMVDFGLGVSNAPSERQSFTPNFGGFPETPAPPQNPFHKIARNTPHLLGASQLFGGTQFSSAVRPQHLSPTSSRPSPYVFNNNSISPNPVASSPLKARGLLSSPPLNATSSPGMLPVVSPPAPLDSAATPRHSSSSGAFIGTSRSGDGRRRQLLKTPGEYEPMMASQERRLSVLNQSSPGGSLDEEVEDEEEDGFARGHRARLRRAAAGRILSKINLPAPAKSDDVEVPSTNRKEKAKLPSQDLSYQGRETGDRLFDNGDTVADSQEQAAQRKIQPTSPAHMSTQSDDDRLDRREEDFMPSTASVAGEEHTRTGSPELTHAPSVDLSYPDAIPETSPTERQPRSHFGMPAPSASAPIVPATSSGASIRQTRAEQQRSSLKSSPPPITRRLVLAPAASTFEENPIEDAEMVPLEASPDNVVIAREEVDSPTNSVQLQDITRPAGTAPSAMSTRPSQHEMSAEGLGLLTNKMPRGESVTSSSSLSTLPATPILTSSITLATDHGPQEGNVTHGSDGSRGASPAITKNKRRTTLQSLPKLKTGAIETVRHSRRLKRYPSASTDELARSPTPTAGFEQSLRVSRSTISRQMPVASRPQSLPRESEPTKLFDTMAFAISFQGKKPGETADQHSERTSMLKTLERRIQQAGGKVLSSGFDELFEVHPVKSAATSPVSPSEPDQEIKLLPAAKSAGFAALIADGHSRKAKYMQALALGLPCVATRWITTCLDSGELIDWGPYLLCAGQSRFLGDAIRSRNLVPYDAATARLADIIDSRSRLLSGDRILLVMKKAEEGKKKAYIFLARVLGASLSRVYSVEEARAKLKAAEDLGQPFDWVYVDDRAEKADLFVSSTAPPKEGRKRKRGSTAVVTGPLPKRIRTLSNELVIQSLILGRLIEDEEMDV